MSKSVGEVSNICKQLVDEVGRIVVGKKQVIKYVVLAALTDGHVLFEDYPGLAKTLTVKTFSAAVGCKFSRVQFTPDLLPADITGTYVYSQKTGDFKLIKGPIFTNILLADEINRAPPKTQAALLEAMQERQTTMEGETYPLEKPFLVLATQNPIEYEGTYPLPEAQIDRFLMKLNMGYPSAADEFEMLRRMEKEDLWDTKINTVASPQVIVELQKTVSEVHIDDELKKYIVGLVQRTRMESRIDVGISPRGSIAVFKLAKAHAAFYGRDYVVPDDIKNVAVPALSHRLILKAEARIKGVKPEAIVTELLQATPVPTVAVG
ncbi:MAG: MoxR family ATPase [Candidatus Thermoplasmatota archaeon]|nr:MoxR family ATPase [Candidatus Thermoplasmatota archaeon]